MGSYYYGGSPTKNADDKFKSSRQFILDAVVKKDGDITVRMSEGISRHTFVFTKEAIRAFYYEHPIKNRFTLCNQFGSFKRCQNSLCCSPAIADQLILKDGREETISAVRRGYKKIARNDGTTYDSVEWEFDTVSDDGDAINFAWGNEVRYCAFIEAFTAALYDGSKCGVYEWLYKSCCFGAAS